MTPRYLIGETAIADMGQMYVELLRQYGIHAVAEMPLANSGYAGMAKIWLIDPRPLLDEEQVALIRDVLGADALNDRIDKARGAAREWRDEQAKAIRDQLEDVGEPWP